jgi:hypothetical protein
VKTKSSKRLSQVGFLALALFSAAVLAGEAGTVAHLSGTL